MWMAILFAAVFLVVVIVAAVDQAKNPQPVRPKRKRYVMRGYGGGKNATSLHPRQAKRGMRIVYIPGVGYRHVRPGKKQR
jgi:hypothetical protein